MVFFVCEGCNETLKKNKVDQHASRCRNCWAVSCVDCSVVFKGNDYAAHTSCISEAQKYEGSLYREKTKGPNAKKESPQERWMRIVQSASAGSDSKFQNVLDRIAGYDNVPRKRVKFLNFMKNSIALNDQKTVERVWELYEANYKAAESEAKGGAEDSTTTDASNDAESKKRTEREEPTDAEPAKESKKSKTENSDKPLKWAKLIKSTLKSAPSKQLETNELRSQVIEHIVSNKLSSKSEKELKKEFKTTLKENDILSMSRRRGVCVRAGFSFPSTSASRTDRKEEGLGMSADGGRAYSSSRGGNASSLTPVAAPSGGYGGGPPPAPASAPYFVNGNYQFQQQQQQYYQQRGSSQQRATGNSRYASDDFNRVASYRDQLSPSQQQYQQQQRQQARQPRSNAQQLPSSPLAAAAGPYRGSAKFNPLASPSTNSNANRGSYSSVTSNSNAIEEGDYVWVNEPGAVSIPAVVVRSGYMLDDVTEREEFVTVVHTEDGEEREIRGQPLVKLPSVHHPKQLPPLNIHDLSSLPLMATNGDVGRNEYFSKEQLENTVLYTLRARYRMEQIYTWVDRVLVSVNPVVALPIYTPDHMQEYNKSREQTPLFENGVINEAPPHIFAIAQNAIRCMQDAAEDQAVILLGGMGSGKSEAAKLIVQYLCEIGENTVRPETQTDTGVLHPIGQQILHALYILEAFGNASTQQNRNSSRFAKMISVEFDKHGHVIGGGFTTHYFEKSRVIGCRPHERNFHVFYQILAGLQQDTVLRDAVDLNRTVADFELLKTADPEMTDPALDARDYRDLMASFSALRIRKSQRVEIIRILAALLHLGNVDFVQENDGKSVNSNEPASCALKDPSQIVLAAKLLEVEPVVLDNYFRTRQFFSKDGNKTVSSLKVVTVSQARRARDTFIRSLYEALFNFLVETLNGILGGIFDRYEKSNIVINSQGVHVLDIVGFENLESSQNGFDQLCFNYWSEKVQSFYVHNTLAVNFSDLDDEPQHVENRLTAYSNMDIATDQEECLSLFERDPFGIFSLLNDHSKMRSPNDEDLVTKILAANDGVRTLSRPNMGGGIANEYLAPSKDWRLLFVVHHYAGKVTYSGKGLAAKNTLSISATCAAIMHSSSNAVLHAVGAAQMAAASNEKASRGTGAASSKFRQSMSSSKEMKQSSPNDTASSDVLKQADDLLHALNHTGKNFLVCVKPSEELEEGLFDSDYVLKQIRQSHLVDLITASRSIYTVHLTYNHFFRQYKNICGHRGTLESLLRSLSAIGVLEEDKYVVGKLKVYLTSHQSKKLEKARFLYLNACATMIQRNMLRGVFRKKSSRLLYVMRGLQQAMKQRDTDDIIQHLANCTSILGKANASDIRVLNEGKRMISSLDEEDYVKSVIADATKIGHPSLIDYAIRIAEKYCPSVKIDHLKKQRKTVLSTVAQQQRDENLEAIHKRLRESIIKNDPEALMAALATLEEPSAESLERQLATMMIIRALEEKSVTDQLTHAAESIGQDDDADKIYEVLHAQMIKAIELGLEAKFPHLVITFGGDRLKSSQPAEVVQPESKPTLLPPPPPPESSVATFNPSALLAALEKALDEENFIAAEKVLGRLKSLGVPPSDMTQNAEQKIRGQLSSISSHSERKQTIKFLGIAKLSQDLELLNEAIEAAVNNGVAKWDFNLKNAEREREKLLAANGDAPAALTPAATPKSISTTAPAPVTPPKPVTTKAEYLFQIWSAMDAKILRAVKMVVPAELKEAVDSKLARLEKVVQAEKDIQLALASKDTKTVEEAFKQSISIGFCSTHFGSLFEHYIAISKDDSMLNETDELRATIKFLKNRMDAKSEIREDALGLLSSVIDEFSRTKDMHEDDNEDVLVTAGKLRRQLEGCVAAAVRLESMLVMPPESISVNALELNIQAARNAGVNERLLVKAEEKIVVVKKAAMSNRTKTRSIQSAPVMGLDDEFDAQLLEIQRNRSDTTGWPGVPDDDGNDMTEQNQRQAQEKDAVAFNQFENLRGYNAQSEKMLAKKLCWDGRALSQSLSVLDDVSVSHLALSINRCILGYMRDRIVFYREMLAQFVLQSGLAKPAVVDEIYLQLMKQLTRNPKRDSSTRGWSLFSMCATSFPPSEALQPYVLMFLKAQHTESNSFWRLVRNFASYSLMKLENLLANGATGFIPSIEEIRGFEARPPFLAKIELLDGTVLNDAFPVTPELTVEHLIEICSHFLGLEDHVANFLGLSTISEKFTGTPSRRGSAAAMLPNGGAGNTHNEGTNGDDFSADTEKSNETGSKDAAANTSSLSYFHKLLAAPAFLNAKAFLGDIFEKELIRGREVRFVLKIRLSPAYMLQYSDEMYDRLTYIQVLDEIVKGNLPLLEEDSVLRLASLSIAVDCGEDPPESVEELFDMNIFDYIPSDWHSVHSEEEWADLVLQFISENLVEEGLIFPASELQRAYIEEVTRHRLYGAAFFPCKLLNRGGSSSRSGSKRDAGGGVGACLGIELPSYFVLAVNSYGVHFLGRDGAILAFCEYMDVVYCGGSYHQYKISLKKASDPSASAEEVLLTTKYSDELSALIADYKEITALINES